MSKTMEKDQEQSLSERISFHVEPFSPPDPKISNLGCRSPQNHFFSLVVHQCYVPKQLSQGYIGKPCYWFVIPLERFCLQTRAWRRCDLLCSVPFSSSRHVGVVCHWLSRLDDSNRKHRHCWYKELSQQASDIIPIARVSCLYPHVP